MAKRNVSDPAPNSFETDRKDIDKAISKYEDETYSSLTKQIEVERKIAEEYLDPWITEQHRRLKLYNNQRRDKKAVGDPLLFSVHNTVLASLYDDELMVEFIGREEGDEEQATTLNALAENDMEEMEKDLLDYDWDWDTLFFGRGLCFFNYFDPKAKTPIPEILDPTLFLRDPRGKSVNGNRMRKGALRFFGWWSKMTKWEMKENPSYFDIEDLKFSKDKLTKAYLASIEREQAKNTGALSQYTEEDLKDNGQYDILHWFTYWRGDRVMVGLGNDGKDVVKFQKVKEPYWSVVDRALYPTSHDWNGTSIADLTEDKQRARAIILNQKLKILKYKLRPRTLYDKNKITNEQELEAMAWNQFVPVDGNPNGATATIHDIPTDLAFADYVFETLANSAQQATATPEIQQGAVSKENRTLGELNLVASRVDTRYSLSAKLFGISEKRFWRQWYQIYKRNYKSILYEKSVQITGAFGTKHRKVTRDDIITTEDPNIKIESRILNEARRMKKLGAYREFVQTLTQVPGSNIRYAVRKYGKLLDFERDEVDRLLPPTIDERIAEFENEALNDDKLPSINPSDNHDAHLEIHNKARDTDAKKAHIAAHIEALRLKKENPEMFPPDPNQPQQPQQPGTPGEVSQQTQQQQTTTQSQAAGALANLLGSSQPV